MKTPYMFWHFEVQIFSFRLYEIDPADEELGTVSELNLTDISMEFNRYLYGI